MQGGTARGIFTGYYIRQFPLALGAFERAGHRPDPIPNPFYVHAAEVGGDDDVYHFQMPEIVIRKGRSGTMSLLLGSHESIDDRAYRYDITGPDGTPRLTGNWPDGQDRPSHWLKKVELPAESPRGLYRVHLSGKVAFPDDSAEQRSRTRRRHGRVLVPIAPPDVGEVMVFPVEEEGIAVAPGGPEIQYWFLVPEEVEEFWIEFPGSGGELSRVSVWNPDGERVWERSRRGDGPGRASIAVRPEHAGRLWRASGGRFVIDPRIPPYFAASPAKWFDPRRVD